MAFNLRQVFRSKRTGEFFLSEGDGFIVCAYTFDQNVSSDEWTVIHNNNSTNISIQVFVDDELVIPDEVIIDDGNKFRIKFLSPQIGFVNFVVYKQGPTCGVITNLTPTPTISVTPTLTATTTPNVTPTPTTSADVTPTVTPTSDVTPTPTVSADVTPTVTPTSNVTPTAGVTPTPTISADVTPTPSLTPDVTSSVTPTPDVTPTSSPAPAPVTVEAFVAGGSESGSTYTDTVEGFPYSSPFTSAASVGTLSKTYQGLQGFSSDSDGYIAGVISPTAFTPNEVDRFPFSTPLTSSSVVGDLSGSTSQSNVSISSSTDGYHNRGEPAGAPGFSNDVDRFPFAAPFATATVLGQLSYNVPSGYGAQDGTTGFIGNVQTSPAGEEDVISYPFASPFASSVTVGTLLLVRTIGANAETTTDGYTIGGGGPSGTTMINRYPFSTPFTSSTDVGDLTISVYSQAAGGIFNSTDGFSAGGSTTPTTRTSTVNSFPFSGPFGTAADVGDLNIAKSSTSGHRG